MRGNKLPCMGGHSSCYDYIIIAAAMAHKHQNSADSGDIVLRPRREMPIRDQPLTTPDWHHTTHPISSRKMRTCWTRRSFHSYATRRRPLFRNCSLGLRWQRRSTTRTRVLSSKPRYPPVRSGSLRPFSPLPVNYLHRRKTTRDSIQTRRTPSLPRSTLLSLRYSRRSIARNCGPSRVSGPMILDRPTHSTSAGSRRKSEVSCSLI
jgi:hypothetical protein